MSYWSEQQIMAANERDYLEPDEENDDEEEGDTLERRFMAEEHATELMAYDRFA